MAERGSSLLEAIFATLISAIIVALLLTTLSQSLASLGHVTRFLRHHLAVTRATQLVKRVTDGVNTSPLSIAPRTHPSGSLTFADGSVLTLSGASGPGAEVTPLTGVLLDPGSSMTARDVVWNGNHLRVIGCAPRLPTFSRYRSFIVAAPDGRYEMQGSAVRVTTSCAALSLTLDRSVALPHSSDSPPIWPLWIVPVEEIFTVYSDRGDQLRYLQHAGADIIENQPVMRGITGWRTRVSLSEWGSVEVHFTLATQVGLVTSGISAATMPLSPGLTFLLGATPNA